MAKAADDLEWPYLHWLRVNVDGTVYSTKTISLKATTTNPVIINK